MFFGESPITVDDKGRIAIPTQYREELSRVCSGRLVVTRNPFERDSLWLYPLPAWEGVRDQVLALSQFDAPHRELRRALVGTAQVVELDGSGRLQLPASARTAARLDRRAVLLGMGERFELWNESAQWTEAVPLIKDITPEMRALRI